jgi:hypothetical protein
MIAKRYFKKNEVAWTTINTTPEFIDEFKKKLI